ncbi:probable acyl-activating enzyme 9 isoform X2 [Citrus clementina]|uniref:probable acyl-activating enzyme 9 isoform X2 n=1 Tax=Citrus clementina TaxID=85681 RepID=UPI000CED3DBD|nr:probable acyl-activating enzyme 9 isoform X2 [Citrus x clementina]
MEQLLLPNSANSTPLTTLGFLERAAAAYTDCPSLVYNNTTYTWSETHRRCLQVASSLSSVGIQRGHVVSVVAPNVPSMYELQFGVPMSGAILNNINTRLDAHTLSVLLQHSESKLVFVDHLHSYLLLEALSLFPRNTKRPHLVLIDDDAAASSTTTTSPTVTVDFIDTYEGFVEEGDPKYKWVQPRSEWDPMVLNYTSGTTSSPKGVVHSHRGIFILTANALIDWAVPKLPVYLWTLPMFHANGWGYTWGMAAVGATNICLRRFDASTISDLIQKHNVTHMCGAPVVLNMISNSPDFEPLKTPVQILTAGAPPPAPVLSRTESMGFVVSHGYGLTETAGLVVSCAWKPEWDKLPLEERARLKARQGVKTVGLAEVDVVNPETGESVKRDGVSLGEVVLRGGCVTVGYFKDKEATRRCISDNGWFYTGDIGVMHADGYVEIKDRSKDVIISGGENICSAEVESVLYSITAVNEAAVVARPDMFWGEIPCAFVSLKRDLELTEKPTEKEIIEYCRARLPRYMVPRKVVFSEELPKTSTGKIQKYLLREFAKSIEPKGRGYTKDVGECECYI